MRFVLIPEANLCGALTAIDPESGIHVDPNFWENMAGVIA